MKGASFYVQLIFILGVFLISCDDSIDAQKGDMLENTSRPGSETKGGDSKKLLSKASQFLIAAKLEFEEFHNKRGYYPSSWTELDTRILDIRPVSNGQTMWKPSDFVYTFIIESSETDRYVLRAENDLGFPDYVFKSSDLIPRIDMMAIKDTNTFRNDFYILSDRDDIVWFMLLFLERKVTVKEFCNEFKKRWEVTRKTSNLSPSESETFERLSHIVESYSFSIDDERNHVYFKDGHPIVVAVVSAKRKLEKLYAKRRK